MFPNKIGILERKNGTIYGIIERREHDKHETEDWVMFINGKFI